MASGAGAEHLKVRLFEHSAEAAEFCGANGCCCRCRGVGGLLRLRLILFGGIDFVFAVVLIGDAERGRLLRRRLRVSLFECEQRLCCGFDGRSAAVSSAAADGIERPAAERDCKDNFANSVVDAVVVAGFVADRIVGNVESANV